MRIGDSTWQTSITQDGLDELKKSLLKVATRQTAVACYVNNRTFSKSLKWIVGSKSRFGASGEIAVSTTKSQKQPLLGWKSCVSTIASSAGICHDLGKFNNFFQNKLKGTEIIRDAIRHEWISMHIVRDKFNDSCSGQASKLSNMFGDAIDTASANTFKNPVFIKMPNEQHLNLAVEAMNYVVATHHKILDESDIPSNEAHVSNGFINKNDFNLSSLANFDFIEPLVDKAILRTSKLHAKYQFNSDGYRMISTVSRAALILADQYVSSLDMSKVKDKDSFRIGSEGVIANTMRDASGKSKANQSLEWHLLNVSRFAAEFSYHMTTWSPEGLDDVSIANISKRSGKGIYEWQDVAFDAIFNASKSLERPSLMFNLAGTGSGKTRMNAKCIVAATIDSNVRFSSALNLKSLTLQTGDSYQSQLKINKNKISVVIGDVSSSKLHDHNKTLHQVIDDDGNVEESFYSALSDDRTECPEWLKKAVNGQYKMEQVILSPVLVSTIDWLIAAGDPGTQGNYGRAIIRAMHSDLILDEIDGYEPNALSAVLRLVMLCGMFGRNLVASSATLSKHVAQSIYEHYLAGTKMRRGCEAGDGTFNVALISDSVDPSLSVSLSSVEFADIYTEYTGRLLDSLKNKPTYRLASLLDIEETSDNYFSIFEKISREAESLHYSNKIIISGKNVSFGLIRVANIKSAIRLASYLSKNLKDDYICCYHSQLRRIHRSEIERRLDALLSRGHGDDHILKDKEILNLINDASSNNIKFIVVATPVEEIGRDHDFDWAIIEPSSAQSIVQTSGRVNRHRKAVVNQPNISIMRFNFRHLIWRSESCFNRPGYEDFSGEGVYASHDLKALLNFNGEGPLKIDASIRLDGTHQFAIFDDINIRDHLNEKTKYILAKKEKFFFSWYSEIAYLGQLRDFSATTSLTLIPNEPMKILRRVGYKNEFVESGSLSRVYSERGDVKNAWLSYDDDYLLSVARRAKISNEDAFLVNLAGDMQKEEQDGIYSVDIHSDFGCMLVKS